MAVEGKNTKGQMQRVVVGWACSYSCSYSEDTDCLEEVEEDLERTHGIGDAIGEYWVEDQIQIGCSSIEEGPFHT